MKLSTFFLAAILSLSSFSAFSETININKANASALQHYLNGVGQIRAEGIVKYRKDHKKFKTLEGIMKVKGIGEAIFKKNKSKMSLKKGVTKAPIKVATKQVKKKVKASKSKK